MMSKTTSNRLLSIDIFRGLTVALMIFVNGFDNKVQHPWFSHASWHGCTLADMIFPFFIFILGVSVAFSISKLKQKGLKQSQLIYKTLKRTIFLFAIGLLINGFPNYFDLSHIRLLGVLQRIAICYLFTSILFILTSIRGQLMCIVLLLIGYWYLMTHFLVPGFEAGSLTYEGNVAGYLDKLVIPANWYLGHTDPEGLFSTMPAIASALFGNITGAWLLYSQNHRNCIRGLMFAGFLSVLLGWSWGLIFPMNKQLWTSSYVLWTSGFALFSLSICYWLIDVKKWKHWFGPFEFLGISAMSAFVLHVLYLKLQAIIYIKSSAGDIVNLRAYLTDGLFGWVSHQNASICYSLAFTIFIYIAVTLIKNFKNQKIQKMTVNV